MARPRLEIDPKKVEAMAAINCTVEEIASVLDCSKDTLERRFAANIKRGKDHGKSSLRRLMWEKAKSGNVTMMIWLSKQLLGYSDKVDHKNEITNHENAKVIITLPDNGFSAKNTVEQDGKCDNKS